MNFLSIFQAALAFIVHVGPEVAAQHWYGGTTQGKVQNALQIIADAVNGAGVISQNLANSAAATSDLHPELASAADAISNGAHPIAATAPAGAGGGLAPGSAFKPAA
jgi:hypothetical protein